MSDCDVSDCGVTVVVSPLGKIVFRVVDRLGGIVTTLLAFEMIVLPKLSEVSIKMPEGVIVVTSPLPKVAVIGAVDPVGRVIVPPASSTTVWPATLTLYMGVHCCATPSPSTDTQTLTCLRSRSRSFVGCSTFGRASTMPITASTGPASQYMIEGRVSDAYDLG